MGCKDYSVGLHTDLINGMPSLVCLGQPLSEKALKNPETLNP